VTALTHDQRVAKLLALTADVEDFDEVERIWARGLAVTEAEAYPDRFALSRDERIEIASMRAAGGES
jgi:hypothetical protein